MKLKRLTLTLAAGLAALSSPLAHAQDGGLTIAVGLKAWYADWTTWFVEQDRDNVDFLTQEPAKAKLISVPQLSVRYKDFVASVSTAVKSKHEFPSPVGTSRFERTELDVNFGYYVTPGLAATVGYKRFTQTGAITGVEIYEVAGPTIGLSGSASLAGAFSMYGALGLGQLKLTGTSDLSARYSLSEVGLAYGMPVGRLLKAVSLTAGYRMQVITARGVVLTDSVGQNPVKQDARDLTQGFTFGIVGVF